ncbi:hypothetical protein MXB_4432 [Myxobolus squamalis]|nr:hypothetical protein MXB_4432 [Myxobolus squamalis]
MDLVRLNSIHDSKFKQLLAIIDRLITALSQISEMTRNFCTRRSVWYYNNLSIFKSKKECPDSKMISLLHSEIINSMQIYFRAMNCSCAEIITLIPVQYLNAANKIDLNTSESQDLQSNYKIFVKSICNISLLNELKYNSFFIKAKLYYCSRFMKIGATCHTCEKSSLSPFICIENELTINIPASNIRDEMGLIFYLYGVEGSTEKKIFSGYLKLCISESKLISGDVLIGLMPVELCPKLKIVCRKMHLYKLSSKYPFLHASIPKFHDNPTKHNETEHFNLDLPGLEFILNNVELEKLIKSMSKFVTTRNYINISNGAAKEIWFYRERLLSLPSENSIIPLIIYSGIVDLATDVELNIFLQKIPVLSIEDYLLMLGPSFSNYVVKKHMLKYISIINTETFCNHVDIFVRSLAYESNMWSTLMCLLIQRSWDNLEIAHKVFWTCKLLSDDSYSLNNFAVLMATIFACSAPNNKKNFVIQLSLLKNLIACAKSMQNKQDSDSKKIVLFSAMKNINELIDSDFNLPLSFSRKVRHIKVEKCKVFSSASSPILIVFKNYFSCGVDIPVIFKIGDVLTRDIVTINIFRLLYKMCFKSGTDLRMRIYDVLATGNFEGFIEAVPDVTSLGEIHAMFGLTGTFNSSCIVDWLKQNNRSRKNYQKAVYNFILSCAGYCVATYILGICKEYESPNETGFQFFAEKCCNIYQLARKNSSSIFNLINCTLASDPNINEFIDYLYQTLMLGITDNDAYMAFHKLIQKSMNTQFTQINFFIHNIAQRRKSKPLTTNLEPGALFLFSGAFAEINYIFDQLLRSSVNKSYNIKSLNVLPDSEFVIQLKTYPSQYTMSSKKKSLSVDSLFLEKFEIPYQSVIKSDDLIILYLKICKFFSDKIIGKVEIKISEIDYSSFEGSCYTIHRISN